MCGQREEATSKVDRLINALERVADGLDQLIGSPAALETAQSDSQVSAAENGTPGASAA